MSFEDVDEIVAGFHMPKNARLVPFNPTHILLMKLDPWQQSLLETWPNYLAHLEASTARGPGYTCLLDGAPLLSFGCFNTTPGVGEAWLIRDDSIIEFPLSVCRAARSFFGLIDGVLLVHRLQFTVAKDNKTALRFAKFFKFEQEGVLRQFAPNRDDYIIMSRIYERSD